MHVKIIALPYFSEIAEGLLCTQIMVYSKWHINIDLFRFLCAEPKSERKDKCEENDCSEL